MINEPAVDVLIRDLGAEEDPVSRYALCVVASKRARQIIEAEKSRGIFMGVMLAACLLIFGAAALVSQGSLAIPKGVAGALPWLLAVLAVGGFIASYFIAQRLYAKKEL